MTSRTTCGIVVTFHPGPETVANLRRLRPQVDTLVVVDNGSAPAELAPLQTATLLDLILLENPENLGIATALNQGVRYAAEHGFTFVALFDQDSEVSETFIAAMLHGWHTPTPHAERLGTLAPRYIDSRLNIPIRLDPAPEHSLAAAMTSGSLIPLTVFQQHGLFLDELFIDAVDYEFSLRLRRAGLLIVECPEAVLRHAPGHIRQHSAAGRPLFRTANYSPLRRYYQERNKVFVTRRYLRTFPGFCLKLFFLSAREITKLLLGEPDRLTKLRYIAQGYRDGLRNRMGPYHPR